jgi:hypothetical protein
MNASRVARPLNVLGRASTTVPVAEIPSSITTLPSTTMSFTTASRTGSPGLEVSEEINWSSLTGTGVPSTSRTPGLVDSWATISAIAAPTRSEAFIGVLPLSVDGV